MMVFSVREVCLRFKTVCKPASLPMGQDCLFGGDFSFLDVKTSSNSCPLVTAHNLTRLKISKISEHASNSIVIFTIGELMICF